jgi:putative DNA primase/helicase
MTTLHDATEQMLGWGMPPFPNGHPRLSNRFERYGPKKRAFYKLSEIRSKGGTFVVVGVFGDWGRIDTQKIEVDWKGIAAEERAEIEANWKAAQAREEAKRVERAELAANRAKLQWKAAAQVGESPYLTRKGVPLPAGTGIRNLKVFTDGTLLVPALTHPGGLKEKPRLVGVQKIAADGSKRFNKGMEKAGAFCRLGPGPKGKGPILVAEGVATALSIGLALEWAYPVVVAFDAYNLEHVARALRSLYPEHPLLFCADDDYLTEGNPGVSRAKRARDLAMPAAVVMPLFKLRAAAGDDAPKWTDFNDLHQAEGLEAVATQIGDALRFMVKASAEASTPDAAGAGGGSADGGGGSGGDEGPPKWYKGMLTSDNGYKANWQNVAYAMQHNPLLKGLVGVDEFQTCLVALRPPPWAVNGLANPKLYPREWTDADDAELGMWMSFSQYPRLVLSGVDGYRAGINAAALKCKTHPLRQWLKGLRWDGENRLDGWIVNVCSPKMEFATSPEYIRLVSRWFLIGAVIRILRPGCKLDHAPIFEGAQGQGKSTLLSVLGGDYFADTPFVMGETNAYLALKGKWIYEIAELDSFNRSEQTRAKAFMSSSKDTYRAPYERRTADHLRQCVFAGTTNAHEYFKDATGNRRYWPVRVGGIDLDALREIREQLLAEAVHFAEAGERYWPTGDEQREIFSPEQESREIADSRKHVLALWLDGLDRHGNTLMGVDRRDRVTVADVLFDHWKVEYAKVDNAKGMETKAGQLLNELGWRQERETGGRRIRYYMRPEPEKAQETGDAPANAGGDQQETGYAPF